MLRVFKRVTGFCLNLPIGVEIQHAVIKTLQRRSSDSVLISKLLIAVSRSYLKTHHETHSSKGNLFTVTRFDLRNTSELTALRKMMIEGLINLSKEQGFESEILELVDDYSTDRGKLTVDEIVRCDSELLIPFLQDYFNEEDLKGCERMRSYLTTLERHGVEVPESLWGRFENATLSLKVMLVHDWDEERKLGMEWRAYEEFRMNRLRIILRPLALRIMKSFSRDSTISGTA